MAFLLILVYVFAAIGYLSFVGRVSADDWRTASRQPAGLAPDPAITPEAVVQVYAARAFGWRGYFGVHTWIAVKRTNAAHYTVHEVIGYRLHWGGASSVVSGQRPADAYWFGNRPELLSDLRGEGVDEIITRIEKAAQEYPYAHTYRIWPGPNSNTFVAYVLRAVPELRVELPSLAIGKDYLGAVPLAKTPSGTGIQVNVLGVAGVLAGLKEGVEVNVLGLTFGINPRRPALKLPLLGRIGRGGDAKPVVLPAP